MASLFLMYYDAVVFSILIKLIRHIIFAFIQGSSEYCIHDEAQIPTMAIPEQMIAELRQQWLGYAWPIQLSSVAACTFAMAPSFLCTHVKFDLIPKLSVVLGDTCT